MKRPDTQRGIGMTSLRTRQRLVHRLEQQGIRNRTVLTAIGNVPRHLFVEEALASRAYEDTALPIGHSQTISQPYVVALMSELLLGTGSTLETVLEIGTGSGYQTAVLAQIAARVYTVERIEALLRLSRNLLYDLRFRNVEYLSGDGGDGWAEHAPYDAIVATAGTAEVPPALLAQLAPAGRLVLPLGTRDKQRIVRITRGEDCYTQEEFDPVRFVPLISGTGRTTSR